MEEELLYPCVNYLAVEVSHNSRDAKIQCSPRAEHSSSLVGVKSSDFNSRTSFAQQYGNHICIDIHFLSISFYSSNKLGFPDQIALYVYFS